MEKIDSNPVIQKTTDYTIFDRVKGNRNLNKAHIQRLTQSLSEDASCILYTPILVNEKFEVVDGQHRLEALRKLNLPVYYIQEKGLSIKNAQSLNMMTKPWSPIDYAKSYSELGNKNYDYYLSFKSTFKLNHDILMKYLSLDNPITGEMFRSGKLKADDVKRSEELCRCLIDVGEYYPRYRIRSFALAYKTVWENPRYDHQRMLLKLSQKPSAIEDRALPEDYIRDLEALYNHSLEAKDRVRFF